MNCSCCYNIRRENGVEYLYSQTGKTWSSDVSRLDPDEPDELTDELTDDSLDEGFAESEEVDPTVGDLHVEPSPTDQQPSSTTTGILQN